MRLMTRALGMIINFHMEENMPQDGSICVANHTTVLDMIVLMSDRTYSTIGQKHGGIIGFVQEALDGLTSNIWFDRSDVNDRHQVSNLMTQHVSQTNPKKDPIMIFPEGTCINNTSVMRFNKGSFEIKTKFYPVAIKYNAYYGDAFWNSSKYSMAHYLFQILTNWCLVADVFYLPGIEKSETESALNLAQRCQTSIAKQICLHNMPNWDGGLKRKSVNNKQINQEVELEQEKIVKKLTKTFSSGNNLSELEQDFELVNSECETVDLMESNLDDLNVSGDERDKEGNSQENLEE